MNEPSKIEETTMEQRYETTFHDLNNIDSSQQFRPELAGQLPKHILEFVRSETRLAETQLIKEMSDSLPYEYMKGSPVAHQRQFLRDFALSRKLIIN